MCNCTISKQGTEEAVNNFCYVIEHAGAVCEQMACVEDLNEPYHDAEQKKEGKLLNQPASREFCSHIWASVQLWKGAESKKKVKIRFPWGGNSTVNSLPYLCDTNGNKCVYRHVFVILSFFFGGWGGGVTWQSKGSQGYL